MSKPTAMGTILADQLVKDYYDSHNGTYPEKVSYTLWAMKQCAIMDLWKPRSMPCLV